MMLPITFRLLNFQFFYRSESMKNQTWRLLSKCALVSCVAVASPGGASAAAYYTEGPSGGTYGRNFLDAPPQRPAYLDKIKVRSGNVIDAIQTYWTNGRYSSLHGGNGGGEGWFDPSPGIVTTVYGSADKDVTTIGFCDNKGRPCKVFGKHRATDQPFWYDAPPGYEIVGFFGRASGYLNAVGVIIRKY